jgi:pimeloyl-ACP methyl ester carboxylesterase
MVFALQRYPVEIPMSILTATLHDGSSIPLHVTGDGPAVLLPVRIEPFDDATAASMRQWGADPDLGRTLVDGLAGRFRVIAVDYEGHRMANPAQGTLTSDAIATDVLAIADAAGAATFAWYGYSWLALAGLQVAIRTDRLWALTMGGFPPLGGPYPEMLVVTRVAHEASMAAASAEPAPEVVVEPGDWDSATIRTSEAQTGQFMTMYEALVGFDERAALARVTCPRLAFAGDADRIEYGPTWGDTVVRIGEPLAANQATLEAAGWTVRVLPGLDHMSAMRSDVVLPLLRDWLEAVSPAR